MLLYNKYRSDNFKSMFGQEHITNVLKGLLKNKAFFDINSIIISGKAGGGKTTIARILAKAINCLDLTDDIEACDSCDNCIAFNKKQYPDFVEIDGATYNKVDDIKDLLDLAQQYPVMGGLRIILIDEAHRLSNSAWDCLLKTLEEGKNKTIFVFATTELYNIRQAIQSRSFIFNVLPISTKNLYSLLSSICDKEGIEYSKESLLGIASTYSGKARDAIKVVDMVYRSQGNLLSYSTKDLRDTISDCFIKAYLGDLPEACVDSEELYKSDNIHNEISETINDLLHLKFFGQPKRDSYDKAINLLGDYLKELSTNFLLYKPNSVENFKIFLGLMSGKGNLHSEKTKTSNRRLRDSCRGGSYDDDCGSGASKKDSKFLSKYGKKL